MKKLVYVVVMLFILSAMACRSSKKLSRTVPQVEKLPAITGADSLLVKAQNVLRQVSDNAISFQTFAGRAKVTYQDENGRQPDANAYIRMKKDSVIWISVNATVLNVEAFRLLITPRKIIIVNKLEQTVEERPFRFVLDRLQLPLDFSMLQQLIVGNALLTGDSTVSYRNVPGEIAVATKGELFQNVIRVESVNKKLISSSFYPVDTTQRRSAVLTYGDYQTINGRTFAMERSITVSGDAPLHITLSFRQAEFNKELSFYFKIPESYKTK